MTYAQINKKRIFLGNVTTVLFVSGLVRGDTGSFRVSERHPSSLYRSEDHKTARSPHTSGVQQEPGEAEILETLGRSIRVPQVIKRCDRGIIRVGITDKTKEV